MKYPEITGQFQSMKLSQSMFFSIPKHAIDQQVTPSRFLFLLIYKLDTAYCSFTHAMKYITATQEIPYALFYTSLSSGKTGLPSQCL